MNSMMTPLFFSSSSIIMWPFSLIPTSSSALTETSCARQCSACALLSGWFRDVLLHPFINELDDLVAVLFQHHHVAIAPDAGLFQPHEVGLHSGLVQPLGDAGVVDAVIGAVARYGEHADVLEVDELPRRLDLHPAARLIR